MNSQIFDRAAVNVPLPTAFEAIRLRVLTEMREAGASQDYCLTHGGIGCALPKPMLSAVLKALRDEGLVFFQIGLWTDGGEMAGAGHGLTDEGCRLADRVISEAVA